MEALAIYDSARMSRVLSMKYCFEIDLSRASLEEVIDEWARFKRKNNPKCKLNLSSLLKHLELLQEQFKVKIEPKQVTDLFYAEFIAYMSCVSDLKNSTITTVCRQLASILKWGALHGARISSTYDKYPKLHDSVFLIALTPDDVSNIYHYDISTIKGIRADKRKTLEKVRDQFVLSCNLGQRYSDMIRISKECFEFNKFTLRQKKTQEVAKCDIDKMAIDRKTVYEILNKYQYNPPYPHDITNYNKYLKFLLKSIGGRFKEEIRVDIKVRGNMVSLFKPKWNLVSSHTARRTFATINVLRGIPEAIIRRATGHRSDSSFQRYIRIGDDF